MFRRLGYYGEILERLAAEQRSERLPPPFAVEIRQSLLYLGQERWTHPAGLDHANLKFRFAIVEAIDLEARPLVENGDVGDAIVAVLCRHGTTPALIRAILQRIDQAPREARSEALAQLLTLANLRKASAEIAEVQADMSIMVNVADIPLLREPIDRAFAAGEAKGEAVGLAKGLVLMLEAQFGPLPKAVALGLGRLQPDDVSAMIRQVPGAASLDAVLGHAPPGSFDGQG